MKKILTTLLLVVLGVTLISAQPYFRRGGVERPSTSMRNHYHGYNYVPYSGFVEMGFSGGVGEIHANQFEVLTTHGLQVNSNLFVGLGSGLQFQFNDVLDSTKFSGVSGDVSKTGVNIPLYVDFRVCPVYRRMSMPIQPFFDMKVGASFNVTGKRMVIHSGCIDRNTNFYMSPSVGFRVPVGYKTAVNVGVTYNLTTQRYIGLNKEGNIGLSSFGARISYEW